MKHLTNYIVLTFLILVLGCQQNSDYTGMEMTEEGISTPAIKEKNSETIERKLIKEGRVEFETNSLNSTREIIFEAVNNYKGYVSSDQEYQSPGQISNTITIRVPSDNFDNLLRDATQGVERFVSKDIFVNDVTEEFLDIQVRIKTMKELEQRYVELLKQTKNVIEILEIEKQIGLLRPEIESIEKRLEYIKDRVSFSTLTMTIYESIPKATEFEQKFKNGFRNGWNNLIWFFVVLINIWPFIFIGLGLIFGIKVYRKRKHKPLRD